MFELVLEEEGVECVYYLFEKFIDKVCCSGVYLLYDVIIVYINIILVV